MHESAMPNQLGRKQREGSGLSGTAMHGSAASQPCGDHAPLSVRQGRYVHVPMPFSRTVLSFRKHTGELMSSRQSWQ